MYSLTNTALTELTAGDVKKLRPLNILLAEDNPMNIKLISILFAQNGLKLQVAENGAAAIKKIKANDFDIVLMDMEMPVLNGYEATKLIRKQLKNKIPIIAMTAHAMPGEREKCLQLGMNDYIAKPIDAALLFKSIYNLTHIRKSVSKKTGITKFNTPAAVSDKVCNLEYLVGITRGNKKIINNIVAVFFKETGKELTYLNDAIEKTNYKDISDISHKIKSAFSILGISLLEPVFKEMEQLSSITSCIGNIELLNHRVNIVFNQAKAEMKTAY